MAIFNSSDNASGSAGGSTTIITAGATFKGELKIECDLFVDGEFEGTIRSGKMVTIGKNGKIKGEVSAAQFYVQGVLEGSVEAEHVEIKAAGRVHGSIVANEFVIEPKGQFEGESKSKANKQAPVSFEIEEE